MLFQIEIPKRNGTCAGRGEKIFPGMEVYSLLSTNEADETIRQDFCTACWQNRKEMDGFVSKGFWRFKVEGKNLEGPVPRIEHALQLLRETTLQEDERYVLVLFLCHAKKILLRKEFQEGESVWGLYEEPRLEEFFKIKIVPISQLEITRLQETLAKNLAHVGSKSA